MVASRKWLFKNSDGGVEASLAGEERDDLVALVHIVRALHVVLGDRVWKRTLPHLDFFRGSGDRSNHLDRG